MTDRIAGVLSPVVTPFKTDLSPDPSASSSSAAGSSARTWGSRCSARTPRPTRSPRRRRSSCSTAWSAAGVDPARMMPGTGCCALTDSVRLTAHAMKLGCGGVLMLPPFYYKGVSDDGLFRSFAEVIERVGDRRLRIYLYHIPPVSQVAITLALIERLLKAYPGIVAGAKDTSGDWNNTKAYPGQLRQGGLRRVPGQRDLPAPGPAARRRGLHQRHRQRQSGRDRQALRDVAGSGRRRAAGAAQRRSAASSRSIR